MKRLGAKAEAEPSAGRSPPDDAGLLAPRARVLAVEPEHAGQRLDNWLLRTVQGVPKSLVYRVIRSGEVRVNGGRASADARVEAGDRIRIPPLRAELRTEPSRRGAAPAQDFPVLYEDDGLLVIDKPAGVAVHGGSGVASGVIERLRAARPQARFLELVHRLDRDTSGVLMLAKHRQALLALQAQLRERHAGKTYQAVLVGTVPMRTRALRQPLVRTRTAEGERRVLAAADGREADTRLTGLERWTLAGVGPFTLVDVKIGTGRTHQIRVHAALDGHPVAGDAKYGDFELNKRLHKIGLKRMFLHAFQLEISWPDGGRRLQVEAPLPAEFVDFRDACGG